MTETVQDSPNIIQPHHVLGYAERYGGDSQFSEETVHVLGGGALSGDGTRSPALPVEGGELTEPLAPRDLIQVPREFSSQGGEMSSVDFRHVARRNQHALLPSPERDAEELKSLAQELQFAPDSNFEHSVGKAIDLVSSIGQRVIGGQNPEALSLVIEAGKYSQVIGVERNARAGSDSPAFSTEKIHVSGRSEPVIGLNQDDLKEQPHAIMEITSKKLEQVGAEIAPEHKKLFQVLKLVAHEFGHVVQYGVGRILEVHGQAHAGNFDAMSEKVLAIHPEHSLGANKDQSIQIHNERFAEGYALAVLAEAVSLLGYSEDSQRKIAYAYGIVNAEGADKMYGGAAGYEMPLDLSQVASDLENVSLFIKQNGAWDS
ncbi:hypothetical protein CSA80_02375 [Candidatus Saccharibacteria bacterium]|nr:MAG: hypothetical protein CSA80_02375 [Candidatus Saccharibacteria bacterium]